MRKFLFHFPSDRVAQACEPATKEVFAKASSFFMQNFFPNQKLAVGDYFFAFFQKTLYKNETKTTEKVDKLIKDIYNYDVKALLL